LRFSIVFFQSAMVGEDVEEETFDERTIISAKMSAARELVSVRLDLIDVHMWIKT
jgi:hypothetical protein